MMGKSTNLLEARGGIEPPNKGFADLCLTTWLPRLYAVFIGLNHYYLRAYQIHEHPQTSSEIGPKKLPSSRIRAT